MADKTAGNAGVQIHPDFEKFVGELRGDLDAVEASLGVTIKPDTADADTQLAKWREENERDLGVAVDAKTADADAQLAKWRAEQEADPLKVKVQADSSSTKSATNSIKKGLADLKKDAQEAATLNLKVLGVVGAAGAVSELLAIVDAASQASRALALLPAAGGALLAGGAAAAIGSSGLSAVFKDYTAQSQDAVGNATKQRDALNALAEAQYSVGQAQRAQQTADRGLVQDEKDLNTAYQDSSRSLRDMNLTLQEQKLNVSDTAIAVREAAKNLQQVQFDPTADADTRQKALDDYQETIIRAQQAQNKQNDLTQDTAQANSLGVAGSQKVIDAQQKVADGINAEADAAHQLQQALVGVQKAQEQVTEASGQSKIDSALAKLSPNAKELVQDVRTLGPAWTDARIAAQDALTNGMGPAVEKFAGVQLPVFKQGIVDIDTALNTGLRSTLAELSTQASKTNFTTFLGNTSAAFANAAQGAAPFTQAITTLATAGSKELPALGQAVSDMATKFDNLILRTTADGQFDAWMKRGITSAQALGGTIEHLGSSVASVFRAAGDGGSLVQEIDTVTGHLATFLKSAQGQTQLGGFFAELRQGAQDIEPLLKDLPGLLTGAVHGFQLWGSVAGPILHEIAQFLSDHPRLVELAIAAYAGFKTVGPVIDGARLAIDYLAKSAGGAAEGSGGLGKLKAAGSGLLGLLGNPWTFAITGAVTGFLTFEESADKSAAAVERFHGQAQQAIEDATGLQKALQSSSGALDTGVLDAEANSIKNFRDALATNAKDIPGITDYWTSGLAGVSSSLFGGLGKGVVDNYDTRKAVDNASRDTAAALDKIGLSNDQLAQKITGSKPAFDALISQLNGTGSGGQDAARKLSDLRDEWAVDASSVTPVTAAIQDLGNKSKDTATSIDAVTSAMERQRQNGLTLESANEKLNEALTTIGSGAQTAGGAIIDASGAIDTTSTKGQALFHLLNDQLAPAWDQVSAAAYRDAIQRGATADQAEQASQRTADATKASAEKSIEQMGYTQSQADELLRHYKLLDGNYKAVATLDTSQPTTALQQYEKLLDGVAQKNGAIPGALQYYAYTFGLPGQYSPGFGTPVAPSTTPGVPSNVSPFFPAGHADGGRLPTSGPGTDRRDGILGISAATGVPTSLLDGGEWVINRDSSQRYNKELAAINAGTFPKLPGYATGGVVGDTPASSSTSPTAVTPGAGNASALIAFARSLVGQPYGGALDCSGLISQLALTADGLAPNSGRMSTANEGPWLGALGWTLGNGGGNGVFSVGWINDPSMPGGGHTAGTLPDGNNIEASGSAGKVLYGPGALGSTASLFTQHAYLNMGTATVNTAAGGLGAPEAGTLATPTPGITSQQVVNPQAPLPAPMTDAQLSTLQDQAAVDAANSQRNAVYANPASTAQDKRAADYKLLQSENQLSSAQQQGNQSLLSVQGIASRAAGIIAGGLLNSLGLGNSVLSDSNPWNQAINKTATAFGSGYLYTPKNLPSIVTTETQQPTPTDPGTASYAGTGTAAPTAANAAAVHVYDPAQGAGQWLGTVQQVLQATGRNLADAGITVTQIDDESHGDPNAVNNWDSNAAAGHPSKGLLQVIDTTFAAFQDPRFPGTQTTPTANIAAAMNYADSKYGGLEKIWPTTAGYADGGWLDGEGGPRTDSIPMLWWGSNGERLHVMNAKSADQNAAVLDAMNAGARFQPLDMPGNFQSRGSDGGDVHHHHGTVNIHDPQIMDMGEFMHRMNQHQAMATLGSMSAWPV